MSQFLHKQKAQQWFATHNLLTTLLSLFAILVSIWMISRNFVGDSWSLIRLGNYLTIWLVVALFNSLLIAVWLRRPWQTAGLLLLLALSVYQNQLWTLTAPPTAYASPENQLRVMTFNAHPTNNQMEELAALILEQDLDIVGLQEISATATDDLLGLLADEYPYTALDHQLTLLSRYPVRPLRVPSVMMESQLAIVSLPETDLYIWNVHAPTAVQRRIWKEQKRDLRIVEKHIARTDAPILLLGDLNTTHHNENYQLIANHLTDTHAAAGRGLGLTYPAPDVIYTYHPQTAQRLEWLPFLFRIDYIFASDHWQIIESTVIPDGYGSDHMPLIATVVLE